MNNEPVAWMNKLGRLEYEQGNGFEIPLYTHPAKTPTLVLDGNRVYPTEKTLTDEEIEDFTVRIYNCRTGAEAHEIVLAILRKAQEK
jgi:hypothetical protein